MRSDVRNDLLSSLCRETLLGTPFDSATVLGEGDGLIGLVMENVRTMVAAGDARKKAQGKSIREVRTIGHELYAPCRNNSLLTPGHFT